MISVLRSIDNLLNQFDELSKCHINILSDFDTNLPDIENPLRNIARPEDEQRKTAANILLVINENDNKIESIETIEDFHRHIIRNQHLHRPPNYSSNNNLLFHCFPSRTSSITTESTSFPSISQTTNAIMTSPVKKTIPNKNIIETKIEPKVLSQNSSKLQRHTHSSIRVFSEETINRLSKPKTYHQLLADEKPTIKHVQRRQKSCKNNIEQEPRKCSTSLNNISLPPIKQTQTTNIKSSPNKFKLEKHIPKQTRRGTCFNNCSHPLVFVAPAPTICLTFPQHLQKQLPRTGFLPKIFTTNKRSMIHLKA